MPNNVYEIDGRQIVKALVLLCLFITAGFLAVVSFAFDNSAFGSLIGGAFAGLGITFFGLSAIFCLAFGMNAAKIGLTWVLVQPEITGMMRVLGNSCRALLMTASIMAALLTISSEVVDPNAPAALQAEHDRAQTNYNRERLQAERWFREHARKLEVDREQKLVDTKNYFEPRIEAEESGIKEERKLGGQEFIGERYMDHDRRHIKLVAEYAKAKAKVYSEYDGTVAALEADRIARMQEIFKEHNGGRSDKVLADFVGTPEAQNSDLLRFSTIVRVIYDDDGVNPQSIAILFTVLISVIVEFVPILFFQYLFRLVGRKENTTREIVDDNDNMVAAATFKEAA